MLIKTEAKVLHAFKYGEARLIVDMFTREAGHTPSALTTRWKTMYGK